MYVIFKLLLLLCVFSLPLFGSYPEYQEVDFDSSHYIYESSGGIDIHLLNPGSYLNSNYVERINKNEIHSVLEIGSRDCIDALHLSDYYKCHVFAFEADPQSIPICQHNIKNNPNVTLIPFAIWNENKDNLPFFPVIGSLIGLKNVGASSCYKADPILKYLIQGAINVPATRLDTWFEENNIENIDLICIDAQGATLPILEGLGEKIHNVKYIIAECEIVRLYDGEALLPDIFEYIEKCGFEFVYSNARPESRCCDCLFVNPSALTQ